ncbi:MAG TPA: hypothetical protein VH333_25565 [Pseudonocardiaceae bacterium]|nr:hypothetical protein [Pseudonocardiaceae bacterium]
MADSDPSALHLATVKATLCSTLRRLLKDLEGDLVWAQDLRSIGEGVTNLGSTLIRYADEPNLPISEDDLVLAVPDGGLSMPEVGHGGMMVCWPGPQATAGVMFGQQPGDEHLVMLLDPVNVALTASPQAGEHATMTRFLRELARSALQMANRLAATDTTPAPEGAAGTGDDR